MIPPTPVVRLTLPPVSRSSPARILRSCAGLNVSWSGIPCWAFHPLLGMFHALRLLLKELLLGVLLVLVLVLASVLPRQQAVEAERSWHGSTAQQTGAAVSCTSWLRHDGSHLLQPVVLDALNWRL